MQTRKDKIWIGAGILVVILLIIFIPNMWNRLNHNIYVKDAGIIEESRYDEFMKNPSSDFFVKNLEVGKKYRVIVFLGKYDNGVWDEEHNAYEIFTHYCITKDKDIEVNAMDQKMCTFNDQVNFESRKEYYNWSYDQPLLEYKHAIDYTFIPTTEDIGENKIYVTFMEEDVDILGDFQSVEIDYNVVQSENSAVNITYCEKDEDCVKVCPDCCPCPDKGFISLNKEYVEDNKINPSGNCTGKTTIQGCSDMVSIAICRDNRCEIQI